MSLVGSLEDLGLVDILQIVSLSRKSGMLRLRSDSGDGRIVLCDGLVQAAAVKGDVEDLRSLLITSGCVDAESFERAREAARTEVIDLDEALRRTCGLETERLAALRREHIERSVMRMFSWRSGEFSFEVHEGMTEQDRGLLLPSGLNTQYLAMEATRLGDEAGQPTDDGDVDPDDDGMMFSGEGSDPENAADALAAAALRSVEEEPRDVSEVAVDAAPVGETQVPVSVLASAELPSVPSETLVAIDADLSTLEWLKASVGESFRRTHIFQRRDAALARIRQYLVRGTVPIVVLADAPADRRGPDAANFVERLRSLAPSMPILALRVENDTTPISPHVDGALQRPASPSPDPDRWHLYEAVADQLRDDLAPWLAGEHAVTGRRRGRGSLSS